MVEGEEGEVPWVIATRVLRTTIRALDFILIHWKVGGTWSDWHFRRRTVLLCWEWTVGGAQHQGALCLEAAGINAKRSRYTEMTSVWPNLDPKLLRFAVASKLNLQYTSCPAPIWSLQNLHVTPSGVRLTDQEPVLPLPIYTNSTEGCKALGATQTWGGVNTLLQISRVSEQIS